MNRDDDALDGLLRELARAPGGDDESFVTRVARPRRSRVPLVAAVAGAMIGVAVALCVSPGRAAMAAVDYRRDVAPLLAAHCAPCHGDGMVRRGAELSRVIPGDASRSPLYLRASDGHGPLPETDRRTLALWIDLGAVVGP